MRVRVPARLPEQSVRRVLCSRCNERFEAPATEAATSAPPLRRIPRGRMWAWASVPLAVAGAIVGLSLIQGSERTGGGPSAVPAGAATEDGERTTARFVQQPGYSLALPAGWKRTEPPKGAAFAAESESGDADATLWITRDPGLSFRRFEKRSLKQLEGLADNARVVDRVNAPTLEGSIVELRADAPVGEGVSVPYRVTLRAAGPWRLYFATTTQPGSSPKRLADTEQMHGSLRPEVVEGGS